MQQIYDFGWTETQKLIKETADNWQKVYWTCQTKEKRLNHPMYTGFWKILFWWTFLKLAATIAKRQQNPLQVLKVTGLIQIWSCICQKQKYWHLFPCLMLSIECIESNRSACSWKGVITVHLAPQTILILPTKSLATMLQWISLGNSYWFPGKQ